MPAKRKLLLLFSPSWVSLIIGIVLSLIMVGSSAFLLAQHSGRLGNFSLREYISGTSIASSGALVRTFFSSLKFNTVFSIAFWVLVGFITYNIVYLFKGSVDESVGFFKRLHYVNAKASSLRAGLALRLVLLFIAIALWIVYSFIFAWAVLPAALGYINHSVVDGFSPLYVALAFFIMLGTSHIAVILMRFTLLKARLAGSSDLAA